MDTRAYYGSTPGTKRAERKVAVNFVCAIQLAFVLAFIHHSHSELSDAKSLKRVKGDKGVISKTPF